MKVYLSEIEEKYYNSGCWAVAFNKEIDDSVCIEINPNEVINVLSGGRLQIQKSEVPI